MDPRDSSSRNITSNSFGDNVTINQNNIQNPAADQTDQCLKDLRLTDPRDDKTRIQQTKGGLLKESSNWIFENETFKQWRDDEQNTLLWIKGDPGKGKTMLLCGIIDELTPRTKLAKPIIERTTKTFLSYFFCQGTDSRINNATAVLRGLIYLIIIQERSLISHVQEKYNHAGKDLFLDANAWVALSEMLLNILRDLQVEDIVLVVDALDECETDSAKLLDFITKYASLPRVKWIVSSRNTLNIQQKLESFIRHGILSLELKANAETVSNAVDIYIEHRISQLRSVQHNQGQRDELKDALREKANGTFLWVSLVMKELEDVQSWEVIEVVKEMPMDLSAVYKRMIDQIRHHRRGNTKFCWEILSTIFTAYYPLSLGELGILSVLPKEISEHLESIIQLVIMCGSFLTIREGIVYFIHQSAKDFLSTEVFQSNTTQRHTCIYEQSITAISTLPQNIYGLIDFGFRIKDAPPPEPNPLASMKYSCFYWTDHFCDAYGANPQSETGLALKEMLWTFLKNYVLRWLESVILLGGLADAFRSIQNILRELQFETDSQLSKFLRSIENFIINNGPIIDCAPLQVYGSALAFSQTSNAIKQQQWKERLPLLEDIQGVIETNSAILQTLEGHKYSVNYICFSLNGKMIASYGNHDGTIRVWDAATGATQHTLETPRYSIKALSLSPDCKALTFISLVTVTLDNQAQSTQFRDGNIRLNGMAACGRLRVLKQQEKDQQVLATFSLDGKILATTEPLGSIELWNAVTGVHVRAFQIIEKEWPGFSAITFSPDSKTVASGHEEGSVKLWDVETGVCFRTLNNTRSWVFAIAFRMDGKKLALGLSGSGEKVRLLDVATGRNQATHMSRGDYKILAIAFSPDSKAIALGCDDGAIRVWDAELGTQPWTTESKLTSRTFNKIMKIVLSPDAKILASLNLGNTQVDLWDTTTGTRQNTFELPLRATGSGAIAFSPNGRTLGLGCDGIWLWDIATGQRIHHPTPMRRERPTCTAIAFSPNGEEFLRNTATGQVQRRFKIGTMVVQAITFLPGGKKLAAGYDSVILVWDAATGVCLQEFTIDMPWGFRCTSITALPDGPFLCLNHRYIIDWLVKKAAESLKHDLLLVDGEWITKGGKRLFWLPREYRTGLVAVQGNIVAIGHKSEVTFLRLKF
ncbi:hypothetical protein J3E68DRAFT_451436 [Trichoderma sp. SZMC 28012]